MNHSSKKFNLLTMVFYVLCLLLFLPACDNGNGGTAAPEISVPLANAGEDIDVLINEATTLDGTGSVGVTNAQWTVTDQPSGASPTLSNTNTLQPTFTADVPGNYTLRLSINDGSVTDTVVVTAKTILAQITVPENSAVSTRERFNSTEFVMSLGQENGILSAENSRVAPGKSIDSFSWEQVVGPGATAVGSNAALIKTATSKNQVISGTTGSTLEFNAPGLEEFQHQSDEYKWQVLPVSRNDTRMVFKVTITDSEGLSDSETIIVFLSDDNQIIHQSSGLPNVGVDRTIYLSGASLKANANAPSTELTDWSWSMTPPQGSQATFLDSQTLSSNLQLPKFIPDIAGLYTINFSSTSANTSGTLTINAARWVGVGTIVDDTAISPECANCHDGSIEADRVTPWSQTAHASLFENSMNLYAGLAPTPFLWEFHTVGFNTDANNNGFDDRANAANFTFPESGLSFVNFVANFPEVAELSNVQCENCHGPGSQHAGDPLRIAHSASQAGVCGQCHIQEDSWKNSAHNSTGVSHGRGAYQSTWVNNAGCVRCHTAKGFELYISEGEEGLRAITETGAFPGITCAACHNPHSVANEDQLRLAGEITMIVDNSTVDAGKAATCYSCHDGFYEHGEEDCDADHDGTAESICETIDQAATQYFRQVHYNPQAPVLEGKGILTDLDGDGTDDFILDENSFHSGSNFTLAGVTGNAALPDENNKCVTCHLSPSPSIEEEGFDHLGGHSFKLRTDHGLGHLQGEEIISDIPAEAGELELISACTDCHPSVTTFNRTARADYDGDGTREGIQDEIRGLLLVVSDKIKSLDTTNINQNSGTLETDGAISVDVLSYTGNATGFNATTDLVRRAIWNYNFIVRDGSLGVHNAALAIQTLQGLYTGVGGESFATDFPSATIR